MKLRRLRFGISTGLLGLALFFGVGMVSTISAQEERDRDYRRDQNRDRERDRDYRRDRRRDDRRNDRRDDRYGRGNNGRYGDYGNYGYGNQIARDRGYQDGLQTGANDANQGKSYDPQRSHYYKNATYGYDRSYGNRDQYKQVYRDSFVQGYNEGYRRYGGNRRNNGRYGNGRWFPW
jgi:hypothetical protein